MKDIYTVYTIFVLYFIFIFILYILYDLDYAVHQLGMFGSDAAGNSTTTSDRLSAGVISEDFSS